MKKTFKAFLCGCLAATMAAMGGCTHQIVNEESNSENIATTYQQATEADKTSPYAVENETSVDDSLVEKQSETDYGRIDADLKYYSTNAGDYKYCNVLLPAGYDESKTYPVLYAIHGWGGDYTGMIHEDSYLQILYGNMLEQSLTVPMLIVSVDMYTDVLADKESKTDEEMRLCYDKVIYDIRDDLMPFIESKYPVKTGRENTAVAGVSQGGTESLATGFVNQDKIGYIGSFAPCPGVIPTEFYKDTYWNWPVLDDFTITDEANTPKYIYLSVGDEDPWDIDATLYYGEVMTNNSIANQTDFVEGYAHDYKFWRLCYYNFLKKIF